MSHFNEHALEMAIVELFEQQGYNWFLEKAIIYKEIASGLDE